MSALSMDELAQAVKLGGKYITEQVGLCLVGLHCCPELTPFALQVSFRDILVMSYEGGGVYPTLVGYVLGAVATLFVARCSSWVSSLIPTTLCVVLFLHTYAGLERKSLESNGSGSYGRMLHLCPAGVVGPHSGALRLQEVVQSQDEERLKKL